MIIAYERLLLLGLGTERIVNNKVINNSLCEIT